jgi:hypothetical protein
MTHTLGLDIEVGGRSLVFGTGLDVDEGQVPLMIPYEHTAEGRSGSRHTNGTVRSLWFIPVAGS